MTRLKRILVVDDSYDSRYILGVILDRSRGYETIEAATEVKQLKSNLRETGSYYHGSLVLPGISGVDATRAIKIIQARRIFRSLLIRSGPWTPVKKKR